jgi:monoamine oxidase
MLSRGTDKLVMAVEAPELLPMEGRLIGNSNKTATGSYHLRPFGMPLIEGFFGGRLAHELEAAGPGAFFDFAVAELVAASHDAANHKNAQCCL